MLHRPARLTIFQCIVPAALAVGIFSAGEWTRAQVFVVGEQTATADVPTDFHPTRVELPTTPITERGRRDLIRNLEAEQGFAHRPLPVGTTITLLANGNMTPYGDSYKQILYKKGQFAAPGDRVAITTVDVKNDRIILDLNGGPYLKHRFLRHVDIGNSPIVGGDGAQVTGCRITLLFEGGLPEVSAPEVKALLDPIVDFGVKSSAQAYADSLPSFLKDAIAHHDILVGMSSRMVIASMGAPPTKTRELVPGSSDQHYEEWIYGEAPQTVRFVRFQNDRVTQIRTAALGKPITIRDHDEMQGYFDDGDPAARREIAMGDVDRTADEEGGRSSKPTILNPGEEAPGAEQRVKLPPPDLGSSPDSGSSNPATAGTVPAHPDSAPSAGTVPAHPSESKSTDSSQLRASTGSGL